MSWAREVGAQLRLARRRARLWTGGLSDPRRRGWPARLRGEQALTRQCNICGWAGGHFVGRLHVEAASCPSCGSIARDRFLHHCWTARTPYRRDAVVLETSPRLGPTYRARMRELVDYRCSDHDQRGHQADLSLDLQAIDLDDRSIDIVLTPHVLEHVPDYCTALRELHRILRPGGRVFLQVPVLQGRTSKPAEPEFHEDDTPVHWRFGFDLTNDLRGAGFEVTALVTEDLHRRVLACDLAWARAIDGGEFDVGSIVAGAPPADLAVVADDAAAARHGFEPPYMFVTWEARRSG